MAQKQDFEFQLSSVTQLNVIDKLRELGVGEYVPLPQLVVVGDQSSGKSSVLEALLGLPFARDSGLCTRFATQIAMRRTAYESISVSVIPKVGSSQQRSEKVRSIKKDGLKSLNGPEFQGVFREACKAMNITPPGETPEPGQMAFSGDVLKIELCGPQRENLSVIDIPGIFRTPTPGVTTKADMNLVDEMVRSYIRDERTIILAVLPAPTDIATQSILTMATEVDPDGLRTLGVLTKPDLVDKGGEQNVIDLVCGRRNQLRLGYCIVRNRGQAELSSDAAERALVENSFFNQGPWASLDKDRVGLKALKQLLQELLIEITRREFPKVKQQIDRQLKECKEELANMGPDRESAEQQRTYLQGIATETQKLTDFAIDAYYSRSPIFDDIPALRLPTLIAARNEEFSKQILKRGHTVGFNTTKDAEKENAEESGSESSDTDEHSVREDILALVDEYDYPELSDLLPESVPVPEPYQGDILEWIEQEYRKARGRGLESIGPAVLPALWQQQSKNWEGITNAYMSDVIYYVHNFIRQLLNHVCPDERTRISLLSILMDMLLERYEKILDHVRFIIKVECFSVPMTLNHYYNDNLQKIRSGRLRKAVKNSVLSYALRKRLGQQGDNDENSTAVDEIVKSVPMGNIEHTTLDIHSVLSSYYKVARKRFVDTVCMQGTDYHLLTDDNSPLRIFCPTFVSSLTMEQLEHIAGEDINSMRLRRRYKLKIKALEEGKKLLRMT